MVNDDKPFLKFSDSGVTAFGSPWSGKHGLDTNIALPLKGICFLKRGTENRIHPAKSEDYISELIHQSFAAEDEAGREKVFSLASRISRKVPLWEMECTKDPSAAMVSYDAMSKG